MIRFYSLFVIDEDSLPAPHSQRFNPFHDLTLRKDQTETVNFLLQTTVSAEQYDKMSVLFDPVDLDIGKIEVKSFAHQTLVTAELKPHKTGSLRVGFAFPQSANLHRTQLNRVLSPFLALPCKYFAESNHSLAHHVPTRRHRISTEHFITE